WTSPPWTPSSSPSAGGAPSWWSTSATPRVRAPSCRACPGWTSPTPPPCSEQDTGPVAGSGLQQPPRARAVRGQRIARVRQRAPVDGQTAAADAVGEAVPQLLQPVDPLVQLCLPPLGELLPVPPGRGAPVRQLCQSTADVRQREPHPLRDPDQRHPAQHVPPVPALVPRGAPGGDQPAALVEVQR